MPTPLDDFLLTAGSAEAIASNELPSAKAPRSFRSSDAIYLVLSSFFGRVIIVPATDELLTVDFFGKQEHLDREQLSIAEHHGYVFVSRVLRPIAFAGEEYKHPALKKPMAMACDDTTVITSVIYLPARFKRLEATRCMFGPIVVKGEFGNTGLILEPTIGSVCYAD